MAQEHQELRDIEAYLRTTWDVLDGAERDHLARVVDELRADDEKQFDVPDASSDTPEYKPGINAPLPADKLVEILNRRIADKNDPTKWVSADDFRKDMETMTLRLNLGGR